MGNPIQFKSIQELMKNWMEQQPKEEKKCWMSCFFSLLLLIDWVNSMVVFVARSIKKIKFIFFKYAVMGYRFSLQQTQWIHSNQFPLINSLHSFNFIVKLFILHSHSIFVVGWAPHQKIEVEWPTAQRKERPTTIKEIKKPWNQTMKLNKF